MSADQPLFYVVTGPGSSSTPEAAKHLAAAVGLSPYDAKLKLATAVPQILMAAANRSDAIELQMLLDGAGVPTRCLSHREIVHAPIVYQAMGCYLGDQAVTFLCKDGDTVAVPYADAKVLVKARIRTRSEKTVDGRNGAGFLSGQRRESHSERETSFLLLLYVAGPRLLEIGQQEFNYGCLGGGKSMSSLRNFEMLCSLFTKRFDGAQFDDALCRTAGSYEKVGESYSSSPGLTAIRRERSRDFSDERFVREAAWLIALTSVEGEW